MILLGIDIGTTHCKAGLFAEDGTALKITSRQTRTRYAPSGEAFIDPDELWQTVACIIRETAATAGPIAVIGIASMAETGLLVDRQTGRPRSNFVPWFDTAAQPYADQIRRQSDPLDRFLKTGLRISFKCSVAKLLWLREQDRGLLPGAVWLSAADYIAYRLTGVFRTDCSLAGYTFAFRMDKRQWDGEWLETWGVDPDLFPEIAPSGTPVGGVHPQTAVDLGLAAGIPVAISGHDHAVAAFAMGVIAPGKVFDSMGTAETLIGALPQRNLTEEDYQSGLLYNCHVVNHLGYWLGSLSASGGSVEWARHQMSAEPLSYAEMDDLLEQAPPGPTGILYFPYLLGSGSPHTDPLARGAFIGLSATHRRADLLKAVLEGTAYEVEYIRRTGERITQQPISSLVTAGGGTRNLAWLQIKADVSGCRIVASGEPEATLLGAALVAGIGSGLYRDETEALAGLVMPEVDVYQPDPDQHAVYRRLYELGFLRLQEPIRAYFNSIQAG